MGNFLILKSYHEHNIMFLDGATYLRRTIFGCMRVKTATDFKIIVYLYSFTSFSFMFHIVQTHSTIAVVAEFTICKTLTVPKTHVGINVKKVNNANIFKTKRTSQFTEISIYLQFKTLRFCTITWFF